MKRTLTAIIAALSLMPQAQSRVWTMQECVDHALQNNLTVLQRSNEVESAKLQLTSAQNAMLPQVSAGASQNWSFGRGLTAANTYDNRNTANLSGQIGMQVPLFQGLQTVRTIDYQRTWLRASVEQLEAAKDDVTLQIMAQYLQVLYCGEMVSVAQSQAALTAEELLRRQALLDAGRIPEADMLDAKAQDAQAQMQLVTAQNNRRLALLDLAQILRLRMDSDFEVQTPDPNEPLPTLLLPANVYAAAMERNHSIQASRLQMAAAEQQVKVAQTGYIPRLSASAGLSTNYYNVSGMPNDAFADQLRHNFAQYVGLNLTIPIFDGFNTRNAVHRAKNSQLNAQLQYDLAADNLYKTIEQAYVQAVGARERLKAAEVAVEANTSALAAITEKYNLDRATALEFDNAKNQYIRSLSERTQAKYELLLRARILRFYAHN